MAKTFQYHFKWDPSKARQNYRKHGITFDRAATIFRDANALSEFDEQHSDREERWITIGLDQTGTILVACHTFQETSENGAVIRMISARRATKNETKSYRRE